MRIFRHSFAPMVFRSIGAPVGGSAEVLGARLAACPFPSFPRYLREPQTAVTTPGSHRLPLIARAGGFLAPNHAYCNYVLTPTQCAHSYAHTFSAISARFC